MKKMKKIVSILLCLCMLAQYVPVAAFAAETDGLCDHHMEHTAECHYEEGVHACHYECAECAADTEEETPDAGDENADAEEASSVPAEDENADAGEESSVPAEDENADAEEESPVPAEDENADAEEESSVPAEDENADAEEETSVPAEDENADAEDETSVPAEDETSDAEDETTVPEDASEDEAAVCDCGTDDDAFHATSCPVYVAPENPECFCAEKCTEENVWCDVCGFDYAACQGEDTAVTYAETHTSGAHTFTVADGGVLTGYSGPGGEIEIPEGYGIITISEDVFLNNTTITAITIPSSVSTIEEKAFSGCTKLTTVNCKGYNITIGYAAFADLTSLSSVTFENTVYEIGQYAFHDCTSLSSLTFKSNVATIGSNAFLDCSSLTGLTVEATTIGEYAFCNCNSLASATLKCPTIGKSAFNNATSLKSVTLENVQTIGEYAFDGTGLTEITIPEDCTSIGDGAFYSCTSLVTAKIDAAYINSLGQSVFADCTALTEVTFLETAQVNISKSMFNDCKSLSSISLSASCTSIGEYAFYQCTSLTEITIPSSVTTVEKGAFSGSGLTGISIPSGVTEIADETCYGCKALTWVKIPASVTNVGGWAFAYCLDLSTMYYLGDNSPTYSSAYDPFTSCNKLTTVYVPETYADNKFLDKTVTKVSAEITGVTVTVDGIPYTEGSVSIAPNTESVVFTATGNHLLMATVNGVKFCNEYLDLLNNGHWSLGIASATYNAEFELEYGHFLNLENFHVRYCNDDSTDIGTGIYLTYATEKVYNVSLPGSLQGGTVTADVTQAKEGATVTLTATPAEGYFLSSLTVTWENGTVELDDNNTFAMPAGNVTVAAVFDKLVYVAFHSLSLKGNIGVNYYMYIHESVAADTTGYMRFITPRGGTVKIPIREAEQKTLEDGKTYYIFTATVAAKEMTDIIQGQYFWQGDQSCSDEKTYSVKEYAKYVINYSSDSKLRNLADTMLAYGTYAQRNFNYRTDDLADPDGSTFTLTAEDLKKQYGEGTVRGLESAPYAGATLVLKTQTALRLYFTPQEGVTLTAAMNGESLQVTKSGSEVYVSISNIAAKDLDQDYTITISDGTNSAEITYSVMNYCYQVLAGNFSENLQNLVKALHAYNSAANLYFQ